MAQADPSSRVAAGIPRGGHAGSTAKGVTDDPSWVGLYNDVCIMIGDGRLSPDTLMAPVGEAAALWSIPEPAAQRAFTALERDCWLARCPDCGQWVVTPMKACIPADGEDSRARCP